MKETSEKHKKWFRWSVVGLFLAIVAVVAGVTYFARSGKAHIPAMPRTLLPAEESARAIADLTRRVASLKPTSEEKSLIDQMQALHLKETALPDQGEESPAIHALMASLKDSSIKSARADRNRHLLLGDLLAVRFQGALDALLTAKQSKSKKTKQSMGDLTYQVELSGGVFYRRALENKMIGEDGVATVSRATFEVLFRYRWRLLSDIDPTLGFTPFEKKALYEFTVRFVPPASKERRLDAVDKLAALDRTYDAVVAKALVYLAAGEKAEAQRIIEAAMATGRRDDTLERFSRALHAVPRK